MSAALARIEAALNNPEPKKVEWRSQLEAARFEIERLTGIVDAGIAPSRPFETGDVVRLKSGGQKMTVCSVDGASVDVQWVAGGVPAGNQYLGSMLKRVDKGE